MHVLFTFTTSILLHLFHAEYHPVEYLIPCMQKDGNFTKFLGFLKETDLETYLYKFVNLTVLAPTDDAFDHLPPDVLTRLETDRAFRTHVLLGHFIDQKVYQVSFIIQKTFMTLAGNTSKIHNSLAYDVSICANNHASITVTVTFQVHIKFSNSYKFILIMCMHKHTHTCIHTHTHAHTHKHTQAHTHT